MSAERLKIIGPVVLIGDPNTAPGKGGIFGVTDLVYANPPISSC